MQSNWIDPAPGSDAERTLDDDARRLIEMLRAMGRRPEVADPLGSACVALELSPAQVYSVLTLDAEGALTMGELARRIGVTEKTLTGIVDRMELGGLVQRERDLADRRVVRVKTTEEGARQAATARQLIHGKVTNMLARLDATDRADLFRILDKLTRGPEGVAREHA